jgi:hypothetical protein
MEYRVKRAKREYKEAAVAYSSMEQSHFPPTLRDNIFVRQLSLSQTQPSPLNSKTRNNRRYPLSASIGSEPESPAVVLNVPGKTSAASLAPHEEILNDVDSLADFARRLSVVALNLVNIGYEPPDSGDHSETTEEILRSDLGQVVSKATAEQVMASNFAETIQQILQRQED